MSTAKRSRARPAEASPQPASKKAKTKHKSGLEFLVNEDARAGRKLDAKLTNGVARSKANRLDESQVPSAKEAPTTENGSRQISKQQNEIISISSNNESSDLEDDDEDDIVNDDGQGQKEEDAVAGVEKEEQSLTNTHSGHGDKQVVVNGEDHEMEDADSAPEADTFGQLLQARHPEPIDVQRSLQRDAGAPDALVAAESRQLLQPPTAGSLGTVLTQALKTNDKDLLESCFAMVDINAIRATIQRQQSHHIATLLERIAERIHKRPGRAGRLMIWIQWSLVTHGGYLANQPELMKKLKALAQVTRERANGLQPLLHLKGKLDLLSAQLEARRSMQAASRAANADSMDDEQDVLYIEGQEANWSSDDEVTARGDRTKTKKLAPAPVDGSDDEQLDDEDLPNGYINGIEEDASDDEDEDGNGLLDDEAEESSNDEATSNDEADSDASSLHNNESSSEEDDEVVKQPKPQTLNRKR